MNRSEQRTVLGAFSRTLDREANNLTRWPGLLWPQMYNRLQWADGSDQDGPVSRVLEPELRGRSQVDARPWLHSLARLRESAALIRTLTGHEGLVGGVAYSPDGTRIVSGSWDNTLKVWDAATGEELSTLTGHTDVVYAVAYSPDGTRIVSGSGDETLKVWDAATGAELLVFAGHTRRVRSCAFSPDGHRIVSAGADGTIKIWDAATGKEYATVSTVGPAAKVFARLILLVGRLRFHRMLKGSERDPILEQVGDTYSASECSFSRDGTTIVSANWGGVRTWDARTGGRIDVLVGTLGGVFACAYSPDGTRIVSGSPDKTLKVWDAATGAQLATLSGHTDQVFACVYSPDGTRIVSGSWDRTLKVWDAATGEELVTLSGHTDKVTAVAYSPDGTRIVSGSWDNTLRVWDGMIGAELVPLSGHTDKVGAVAYSPDGTRIVSGSGDETLKVWDAATGIELATLTGHTDSVAAVAYSPDRTRIASGSWDSTLKVWDAAGGTELATLTGHTDPVAAVAYSPDGTRIASGSAGNSLKVWDAEQRTCVATMMCLGPVSCCDFDPRGRRISCGDDSGTVYVLELVGAAGQGLLSRRFTRQAQPAATGAAAQIVRRPLPTATTRWVGCTGLLAVVVDLVGVPTVIAAALASPFFIVELAGLLLLSVVAVLVFFGCAASERRLARAVTYAMIIFYAVGWGALGNALGQAFAPFAPAPAGLAVILGGIGLAIHWRSAQTVAANQRLLRSAGMSRSRGH